MDPRSATHLATCPGTRISGRSVQLVSVGGGSPPSPPLPPSTPLPFDLAAEQLTCDIIATAPGGPFVRQMRTK